MRKGELIGSTRVTSTRLIQNYALQLLIAPIGTQTVSVAPSFVESSPLKRDMNKSESIITY